MYLPKFSKENSEALGRRIVPIRHSNVVRNRDTTLEKKLERELPNITCRMLRAYHGLVEEFGAVDITEHLPPQIREWGGDVRAATSKVYEFLTMPAEERVITQGGKRYMITFEKEEGVVTMRSEFARWYNLWAEERFENDEAAFASSGFESPAGRVQCCAGCKKKHHKRCCENNQKRAPRTVVVHMKMSVVECDTESPPIGSVSPCVS